jgi:hypothetical protein
VSGWKEWAENLDSLSRGYQRPPGAWGMVTDAELCLAETYARHSYTGEGKIVELGCWLGAVTLALARGASENPQTRSKRPIEAFDLFRWEAWMTPIAERLGCLRVPDGESFLDHTKAFVKPYEHLIRLHEGDLFAPERFRHRIEFLFIDAMKSWELANAIVQTYFPNLIPGRSLIVQQDFAYFGPIVATNHILMWLVREQAIPVYHVPGSCSVAFFVQRPFDRSELPALNPDTVTIAVAEQAWSYSMGIVRAESRRDVWLCKVLFFIEQGWLGAAWVEAQRFVNTTGRVTGPALEDVHSVIARKDGPGVLHVDRLKLAQLEKLLRG